MNGLRVGVTGARKGGDLVAALQRRGAEVMWGPTLDPDVLSDDAELVAQTDAVLGARPSWLVASTGVGVTAWAAAAERAGRGDALRGLLAGVRVVARGAKAVGALRALGVAVVFVSPQETDADVVAWLLGRVADGEPVAVQLHGDRSAPSAYRPLLERGVEIITVAPYNCRLPSDPEPAHHLVTQALERHLDVVVATSRPAVLNLFALAAARGRRQALVAAFCQGLAAAAVGSVTAEAFEEAGVPVTVMPRRARTGDLIRALESWASRRGAGARETGRGLILLPEHCAVRAGGTEVPLGMREFALLAVLVRRPHIACAPELLTREAWGHVARDAAHVRHCVSRIRSKLGAAAAAIETVRGVGYRYEPAKAP